MQIELLLSAMRFSPGKTVQLLLYVPALAPTTGGIMSAEKRRNYHSFTEQNVRMPGTGNGP